MRDSHTVSTFCHAACEPPTQQQSTPLPQPANQLPIQPLAQLGHGKRLHPCAASESDLRRKCKRGGFSDLNWPAERAAIPAAAAQLSRLEYHSRAMRHRFCLVAPGDSTSMAAHASHSAPHCPKGCCHLCSLHSAHQVSPQLPLRATTALHTVCASGDTLATPKAVESVLTAARGGCLPVLVIPDCVSCRRATRGHRADDLQRRWQELPSEIRQEAFGFPAERLASLEIQ